MASGRSGTIELRREVLVGLCVALGLALLAAAFLLGRQTARPDPRPLVSENANVSEAAPAPALVAPEATLPEPAAPPVVTLTPNTEATAPRAQAPADPGQRDAVARYFVELAQLEATAGIGGDPQELAGRLVQESALGDRRGLDELLNTERRARETLRGMGVPAACRAHHAEALALMDAAVALLERLGQAMAAHDLDALGSFTQTARELETRTKRLQELEANLKRQYGIAPASS